MGVHDLTVYGMMKRNARDYGERTALIQGEERITHARYVDMVDRLSHGLRALGIGEGDRISIIGENCLEYMYLYGAAAKTGAIVLPVNWRLQVNEMEYLLADGSPKIAFVGAGFQETVFPLTQKPGLVENWYALGPPADGFKGFDTLTDNDGTGRAAEISTDAPFAIIPTAAVAGTPRGAVLSHGNILAADMHFIANFGLGPEDVNIGVLPLFHIAGLGLSLGVMHAGGATAVLPKFDPDLVIDQVSAHNASIFCEFAPMLSTLLEKAKEKNADLRPLRCVTGLDRPDTIKAYQERTGGVFYIIYGQAETSGVGTIAPFDQKPGSAGRCGPLAEIEIIDQDGRILEPGAVGEIAVRGPIVFKGYWNLPEETRYTFRDGRHHTGDLGRLDPDGFLFYEGRKPEKDLIKTGGENVYPSEVEKVILEHPSVREVVVIGVPDAQWQEAIKAVCVLEPGAEDLSGDALKDFVAGKIARFKKPKHVVFVPSLPKTKDGHIDRVKVKSEYGHP